MNTVQREAYQAELRGVAKRLGLAQTGNIEDAIVKHCVGRLRSWLAAYGRPATLSDVVTDFATSLDMRFTEIHSQAEMDALLRGMPPEQKAIIAELKTEFSDDTDAITVLRLNRKPWDQAYLAIINCQGWHEFRRYFSKWHEIGHRLIEGQQLTFAFRNTKVKRIEPEEVLVDRIAAALAFFPDVFEPVVREECEREGCLTLAVIDRVRERIVPDASRVATSLACMRHVATAAWFLRCERKFKAAEIQKLNDPQMTFFPEEPPEPKLRVSTTAPSSAANDIGVRFYENMRVPQASVVACAFHGERGVLSEGREALDHWETSSGGPIGSGVVHVQAERFGKDQVWAIVNLLDEPSAVSV